MNAMRANLAELREQWKAREKARDMIVAGLAGELAAQDRIAELLDEQVAILAGEREPSAR